MQNCINEGLQPYTSSENLKQSKCSKTSTIKTNSLNSGKRLFYLKKYTHNVYLFKGLYPTFLQQKRTY